MHCRGPPPKGNQEQGLIEDPSSLRNLSGWKVSGSGQMEGSWWITYTGMLKFMPRLECNSFRSLLGVEKPLGIKRPSSSQSLTQVLSVLKPGGSSLKVSLIHASRYGISLMLSWSILPSEVSTTSSTSSTSLACTSGFFARQKDKDERVLAVVSKPARMKTIA